MTILALIGNLDGTNSAASISIPFAMESMVNLLSTPPSFWVVIILGVIASPWMVHPPANSSIRRNTITFITAALLFMAAILLFLNVRDIFILMFSDFGAWPGFLFVFPFVLGASPIGAALLVLSWYYLHPIPRLKDREGREIVVYLLAFLPMIITAALFGVAMLMSVMMRIL